MASIAYITDQNMIEYHRLNGNTVLNFWRPGTSSKKFADFHQGDFLFFLVKGTERGSKKEKGIVGYGKLEKIYSLNFNQMWRKYGTLNGYPTKKSLYEAMMKISKDKELPKSLSCLELSEVVFFQAPIYLSELGIHISNHIESYVYLDKEDQLISTEILKKAQEVGIDSWSAMMNGTEIKVLKNDAVLNNISNIYQKITYTLYSKYELQKLQKLSSSYMETHEQCEWLRGSKNDFVSWDEKHITIHIPMIINIQDFENKLQLIIGHIQMYQFYLKQDTLNTNIEIKLLCNIEPNEETIELLQYIKISYEIEKLG